VAGEAEAAKEGIALARELLPLVKEIFGMVGLTAPSTITPSVTDNIPVLQKNATALEKIEENTRK